MQHPNCKLYDEDGAEYEGFVWSKRIFASDGRELVDYLQVKFEDYNSFNFEEETDYSVSLTKTFIQREEQWEIVIEDFCWGDNLVDIANIVKEFDLEI